MRESTVFRRGAHLCRPLAVAVALGTLTTTLTAWGSDAGGTAPAALGAAKSRPHLESTQPQPNTLGIPSAGSSQILQSASLAVPEGLRLLVFAPHPDDETLAAGGLIQRVLARAGTVRVIFVTNGDGYVDGVRREFRRAATSTKDFIEYGRRRHDEAMRAMANLGWGKFDGIFLGFPDDGIDDLWGEHWSEQHPYTSPHTRLDRPPYRDGMLRDVDYVGTDLESEIERTLTHFDPDWVVMPDPRDRHPDHCTTGVFVLDALRRLRNDRTHGFEMPQVYTYLVHSPDYPASPSWVRELAGAGVGGSSTSRATLAAARWFNLSLSNAEAGRKQAALVQYESQFHVMSPFLKQFLTSFELFGRLDNKQIETVPGDYAVRFGRTR